MYKGALYIHIYICAQTSTVFLESLFMNPLPLSWNCGVSMWEHSDNIAGSIKTEFIYELFNCRLFNKSCAILFVCALLAAIICDYKYKVMIIRSTIYEFELFKLSTL
jgi:hypothetical protein